MIPKVTALMSAAAAVVGAAGTAAGTGFLTPSGSGCAEGRHDPLGTFRTAIGAIQVFPVFPHRA